MHPILFAGLLICSSCSEQKAEVEQPLDASVEGVLAEGISERPNIILIVADDLGFTDISALGGEIRTPNIDTLAAEGLTLTQFYTAPSCGPTRAMLFSGTDNHIAGNGVNPGGLSRLPEVQGRPGYEGYLNDRVVSFASLLQDSGYHTYMAGKWDLGKKPGYLPSDRGFDQTFSLADGGASHFGDMLGVFEKLSPAAYFENGVAVSELPEDFFSSTFFTDKVISYLQNTPSDEPFFVYLAFTAPHWPLQVPDDWQERYKGEYDQGWDQIRAQRFARMKAMGLVAPEAELGARLPDVPAWEELEANQRDIEVRRMEIYAAMIEHMDMEIGRLTEHLRRTGQDDNTLILFFSDNGAEGTNIGDLVNKNGWLNRTFDNSLANMGRQGSYVWLGAGWAQASVTPGRLFKVFATEGGIHTPAVVSWPGMQRKGERDSAFVTVMDVAPTLLDFAAVEHPAPEYQNRTLVPMMGKSMKDLLLGKSNQVHPEDQAFGFEVYGRRAIRKGDWKIVWVWPPRGPGRWELFNLVKDPSEANDLSGAMPEKLAELVDDWDAYVEKTGTYVFDKDGLF